MSYETTERIIAIDQQLVNVLFSQLLEQYGEPLSDGDQQIVTIGGHWDNSEKTRIRAASLASGTIMGQSLTDGRIAFKCLWQSDLAVAFDNGQIQQAQQLTKKQLEQLLPPPPKLL